MPCRYTASVRQSRTVRDRSLIDSSTNSQFSPIHLCVRSLHRKNESDFDQIVEISRRVSGLTKKCALCREKVERKVNRRRFRTMENRVFVTLVACFLAFFVHETVTESLEPAVPCDAQRTCADSHLPADAHCAYGFCICTAENGESRNCTTRDIQKKSQDRNPVVAYPCKSDLDCNLLNGFCDLTKFQCSCNEKYVMARQSWNCLPISRSMGSACEDDQQCQALMGNNTACIEKQCVCKPEYHFSDSACWKRSGFGEDCTNDNECSHNQNAVCIRGSTTPACGCSNTSALTSDGSRCLPITMEILQGCIEKAQCTKKLLFSDCIDKVCQCQNNHHFEASISQCVTSRSLGENCAADNECYQDHVSEDTGLRPQMCKDNVCTCNESFEKQGDRCIGSGASSLVSGLLTGFSAILLFTRS